MKIKLIITIILWMVISNARAALIYDSGALSTNGDVYNIYSLSNRSYDSSTSSYVNTPYTQNIFLSDNTTINRIEYYVLSDTYNSTNINISNISTNELLLDTNTNANISNDGGYYFVAGIDGRIRNSYLHTLDNLDISLGQGNYSLSLSLDSNSTTYFGANNLDEIAIKVYGTTNITTVPLPASLWLFIVGFIALFNRAKK